MDAQGRISEKKPPKTTGREHYGKAYLEKLLYFCAEKGISLKDCLATATRFTAECIRAGVDSFVKQTPDEMIVGGGGSRNPVLMAHIRDCFPDCRVMTNEEAGYDGDAKEAIAFAILANEACEGMANNVPSATGAGHPVVMGKISF